MLKFRSIFGVNYPSLKEYFMARNRISICDGEELDIFSPNNIYLGALAVDASGNFNVLMSTYSGPSLTGLSVSQLGNLSSPSIFTPSLIASGAVLSGLSVYGTGVFRNQNDSVSSFQIYNSGGALLLNVDTINRILGFNGTITGNILNGNSLNITGPVSGGSFIATGLDITRNSSGPAEVGNAISITAQPNETKFVIGTVSGSRTYIQSFWSNIGFDQRPLTLQEGGGSVGIGFTGAAATLDVSGTFQAGASNVTRLTTPNLNATTANLNIINATGINVGFINNTGNLLSPSATITNLTGTNITGVNFAGTNAVFSTINANTANYTGNLYAPFISTKGESISGNLSIVGQILTTGNVSIVGAITGTSLFANGLTGNSIFAGIIAGPSATFTNLTGTNFTGSVFNASSSITAPQINATNGLYANFVSSNGQLTTGNLNVIGGAFINGNITGASIFTPNLTGTNISSTNVNAQTFNGNSLNLTGSLIAGSIVALSQTVSGSLTILGTGVFRPPTNDLNIFQIQDSGSSPIINIDSINHVVGINGSITGGSIFTPNLTGTHLNAIDISATTGNFFRLSAGIFSSNFSSNQGELITGNLNVVGNAFINGSLTGTTIYSNFASNNGQLTTGNIGVTGNLTASNIFTPNLTGTNISATTTNSTNFNGNNLNITGNAFINGSLTGSNIFANNLTGNNIFATQINSTGIYANFLSTKGQLTTGNVNIIGNAFVNGTITGSSIFVNGLTGNIIQASAINALTLNVNTLSATGNLYAPFISTNGEAITGNLNIYDSSGNGSRISSLNGSLNITGKVGIGTIIPSGKLEVLATTEQLRLSHDPASHVSFTVDGSQNLTLSATTPGTAGLTVDGYITCPILALNGPSANISIEDQDGTNDYQIFGNSGLQLLDLTYGIPLLQFAKGTQGATFASDITVPGTITGHAITGTAIAAATVTATQINATNNLYANMVSNKGQLTTGNLFVNGVITGGAIFTPNLTGTNISASTINASTFNGNSLNLTGSLVAGSISALGFNVTGNVLVNGTVTGNSAFFANLTGTNISGTTLAVSTITSSQANVTNALYANFISANGQSITGNLVVNGSITGASILSANITGNTLNSTIANLNLINATGVNVGFLNNTGIFLSPSATITNFTGTNVTGASFGASTSLTAPQINATNALYANFISNNGQLTTGNLLVNGSVTGSSIFSNNITGNTINATIANLNVINATGINVGFVNNTGSAYSLFLSAKGQLITGTLGITGTFGVTGNVNIGNGSPEGLFTVTDQDRAFKIKYLGRPSGNFTKSVILLHEAYTGVNINLNYAVGKIVANRGSAGSLNRSEIFEIETSAAFQTNAGSLKTISNENLKGRLVTVSYSGGQYLALEPSYANAYFDKGFTFEGFHNSTAPNGLVLVDYFNNQTSFVINSGINSSISGFTPTNYEYLDVGSLSVLGDFNNFKSINDSTGAFQVQSSGGSTIFSVDTLNRIVGINGSLTGINITGANSISAPQINATNSLYANFSSNKGEAITGNLSIVGQIISTGNVSVLGIITGSSIYAAFLTGNNISAGVVSGPSATFNNLTGTNITGSVFAGATAVITTINTNTINVGTINANTANYTGNLYAPFISNNGETITGNLNVFGTGLFRAPVNNANVFQIQDAASSNIFSVNSLNRSVAVAGTVLVTGFTQFGSSSSNSGVQTVRISTPIPVYNGTGTVTDALNIECNPTGVYNQGVSLSFGFKNATFGEYTSRIVHFGNSQNTVGSKLQLQTHTTTADTWNTGIFIDNNGKVAVNGISPQANLDVSGSFQAGASNVSSLTSPSATIGNITGSNVTGNTFAGSLGVITAINSSQINAASSLYANFISTNGQSVTGNLTVNGSITGGSIFSQNITGNNISATTINASNFNGNTANLTGLLNAGSLSGPSATFTNITGNNITGANFAASSLITTPNLVAPNGTITTFNSATANLNGINSTGINVGFVNNTGSLYSLFSSSKNSLITGFLGITGTMGITGGINIGNGIPDGLLTVIDQFHSYKIKYLGRPSGDYTKSLVLLHEIYTGVNLNQNYAIGKVFANRGNPGSYNRLEVMEVNTASAYQTNAGSIATISNENLKARLVTVSCGGNQYLAIDPPYSDAYFSNGYTFEGFHNSTVPSGLVLVDYFNNQTSFIINSGVNSSITGFSPTNYEYIDVGSLNVLGDNNTFKALNNTTGTFQVQNSGGATIFAVDTLNRVVGINGLVTGVSSSFVTNNSNLINSTGINVGFINNTGSLVGPSATFVNLTGTNITGALFGASNSITAPQINASNGLYANFSSNKGELITGNLNVIGGAFINGVITGGSIFTPSFTGTNITSNTVNAINFNGNQVYLTGFLYAGSISAQALNITGNAFVNGVITGGSLFSPNITGTNISALTVNATNFNGNAINLTGSLTVSSISALNQTLSGNLTVSGSGLFKNLVNSQNAFQVQDSGSSQVINVDTINHIFGVNGTITGGAIFTPNFTGTQIRSTNLIATSGSFTQLSAGTFSSNFISNQGELITGNLNIIGNAFVNGNITGGSIFSPNLTGLNISANNVSSLNFFGNTANITGGFYAGSVSTQALNVTGNSNFLGSGIFKSQGTSSNFFQIQDTNGSPFVNVDLITRTLAVNGTITGNLIKGATLSGTIVTADTLNAVTINATTINATNLLTGTVIFTPFISTSGEAISGNLNMYNGTGLNIFNFNTLTRTMLVNGTGNFGVLSGNSIISPAITGLNLIQIGPNQTQFNYNGNSYTNTVIGNFGVGTLIPSGKLEILSLSEQLRLSHDSSNHASLTVDGGGNLSFTSTNTPVPSYSFDGTVISDTFQGSTVVLSGPNTAINLEDQDGSQSYEILGNAGFQIYDPTYSATYLKFTQGTFLATFGASVSVPGQIISTIAGGTAPITVTSTTVCTNLNADLLDGQHGSYYLTATNINSGLLSPTYGGTGVNNASTITLAGNLVTAGAFSITLTSSATTSVTLPTTGTLATLAGSETFTNKVSYNGLVITANTGTVTTGIWNAGAITSSGAIVGTSLNVGSGTITSGLINGQTISSSSNFTGTLNTVGVITSGTTSGGTYNGNIKLAPSDNFPVVGGYSGPTLKAQILFDVNVGAVYFDAPGGFTFRGVLNSGSIMTLSNAGALVVSSAIQGTTITATTQFSGPGTGLTGTAASLSIGGNAATATSSTSSTSATNATNTAITDDTTTNATMYPTWVTAATGNLPQKVSSTKLSFNPSTGLLTSTGFSGPLTGNVTGNTSGSSGSCTGNALTATTLQTTRAINGVNFDGSAAITVTAAAGTLTGTTLNATVVTSSLTSVGTLGSLTLGGTLAMATNNITSTGSLGATGSRLTAGFFVDLTVTNAIGGSLTGNAATATALQTARAINGVNFDGTGAITVTAAAGTLTGTTLNATVITSSLTSVGTLGSLTLGGTLAMGANNITSTGSLGATGARLTKGWFADLQVTNAIVADITGNAATAGSATTATTVTGAAQSAITSLGTLTSLTLTGDVSTLGHLVLATHLMAQSIAANTSVDAANILLRPGNTQSSTNIGYEISLRNNTGTAGQSNALLIFSDDGTTQRNLIGFTDNSGVPVGTIYTPLTCNSTVSGTTITASASFSGPGTNLTGTAASFTAGFASSVAASALTGTTLASGVTASSLTSFGSSPTIVTPTIASFANANHNHQNSAGGGSLDAAAIGTGTLGASRLNGSYTSVTGVGALAAGSIASGFGTILTTTTIQGSVITATTNFAGALTGNASTATALQTARAINGTNFDGTAAITITAAAGTLTGATLNATVVTSSLTSVGTLTSLAVSGGLIDLTNTTSNWISWDLHGAAAPTFTSRSAGTKLLFNATLSGSAVDWAIGRGTNELWFSAPTSASGQTFKWYGGTTNIATLDATGAMTISGIMTASSFSGAGTGLTGTGSSFVAGFANSVPGSGISGNISVNNLNSGTSASSTTYWRGDGTWATPAGSGTVTSVTLTVPSIMSVSGSPITTSGTFAVTLQTQSANTIFAGPTSGSAATPAFRAMTFKDLPTNYPIASKTANYNVTDNDFTIILTTNAGIVATLPSAVGRSGRMFIIKNYGCSPSVGVAPSGSELLDGSNSASPILLNAANTVQSDGTSWWIVAS